MSVLEFNNVKIGDKIHSTINLVITQEMINQWAVLANDFNPLHIDLEFAKDTKFGSTVAHGSFTVTYLLEMMVEWLGIQWLNGGQLTDVKYTAPVKPGDKISPQGQIVDKKIIDGKNIIECEVWLENQAEEKVIISKAIAQL